MLALMVVFAGILGFATAGSEEGEGDGSAVAGVDLFAMDVLADGHYLVEMAQEGGTLLANLKVVDGKPECVKGEREALEGMAGISKKLANGVFVVQLKNGTYAASQIWAFGEDGNGVVTENPNRGERHRVWRVKDGEVLERPGGGR